MHKADLTPENAALLLIDRQLGTMGGTHSHHTDLVKASALKLAKIAKALDLSAVLTASMEDQVQGPLVPELEEVLREASARRVMSPGPRAAACRSTFRDTDSEVARPPRRNAQR